MAKMRRAGFSFLAALALLLESAPADAASPARVMGSVTIEGRPAGRVLVTAAPVAGGPRHTVRADATGSFAFPELGPGAYRLVARDPRFEDSAPVVVSIESGAEPPRIDLALGPAVDEWSAAPASALLARLPEGSEKRAFVLECTGCHQFDQRTTTVDGRLKTEREWTEAIERMLGYAGADTDFPILSPGRDAAETAAWLSRHFGPEPASTALPPVHVPELPPPARPVLVTEYRLPVPEDLPHDLLVDVDGRVVVTGMLTNVMNVLDPATGAVESVPIDAGGGNPRALDIDGEGNWYVALGAPRAIARRDRATGEWTAWSVGQYPHSIALDGSGRLWFNGHFSIAPERIGFVEPRTGEVETFDVPVPPTPEGGRTIQYGLRVGPDGSVWTTELMGNRLIRYRLDTDRFEVHELPTPASGPRRPDLGADGLVWIPEYAGNRLARFDPETGTFREWELPIADALPYVVRVDRVRNRVWIGTAAADAVLWFDPAEERFSVVALPTRGAIIRHMDVDEQTGDLWVAYSASPARGPNDIARIRVR